MFDTNILFIYADRERGLPLAPTIIVSGKQKAITCSSSLGEKERTPLMESLEMDAIVDNIYLYLSSNRLRYCRQAGMIGLKEVQQPTATKKAF